MLQLGNVSFEAADETQAGLVSVRDEAHFTLVTQLLQVTPHLVLTLNC